MKKLIFSFLFAVVAFGLNAQMITVSVPVITADPGEIVNVPVTLVSGAGSSGDPIGACDLNIDYDDDVLTYIGLTNFYVNMPASEWIYSGNLSMVAANWIDAALATEAIPDGTVLFEMQFTYNGGNSPLTFSKNEFYDVDYLLIPTTPVNGAVNPSIVLLDVTFSVDMSREEVSPAGVHLAGSFNGWNYSSTPMTDDGTGIYSVVLQLEENSSYRYRFVNGADAGGLEDVPSSCGVMGGSGDYEREFSLTTEPLMLNTVCFSRCEMCPPLFDVTFRADMINQQVSVNGVHLAGSFNNWSYSSTPMTLTGAGAVYEVTLQLEEGSYQEFRFVNGNTIQDAETVPSGCSNNGNRYITVAGGNVILDAFCYGECVECGNLPEFYEVTFRVDMKNENISPEGIHIAGSFQGWQPGATPMIHQGNNIYSYTQSILEGTSVEYRFVNGNSASGYETVPAECSMNSNRYFAGMLADTLLPLVCFSSCDTCMNPEVLVTFNVDMSGDGITISPDGVHVAGSFQGWNPSSTPLTGDVFSNYSVTLSLPVGSVQQYRFVNGNTAAGYEVVPSGCAEGENRYFTVPDADTILMKVCFGSCEPCPVGIFSEIIDKTTINIFPNPSNGEFQLELSCHRELDACVKIYNLQGVLVSRFEKMHFHNGSHTIRVGAGNLESGVYLLELQDAYSTDHIRQLFVIAK